MVLTLNDYNSPCDITGCDEVALVEDHMGNKLCIDCMEKEISECGTTAEDYESI